MSVETPLPTGAEPTPHASAVDEYEQYRSLSASAIVSLLLGIVSIAALLEAWWLKAVPVLGIFAGVGALWRIRKLPTELTGSKAAWAGIVLSAVFLVGGSALTLYTEAVEVPDGARRISYTQLKHPDEAKKDFPSPASRALDGQRVFIKGYMFPPDQQKGVKQFMLCRDSGDCCFGKDPPISERIFVELTGDLTTEYVDKKLRHVAGIFHVVGTESAGVKQTVLYRLEADYVK